MTNNRHPNDPVVDRLKEMRQEFYRFQIRTLKEIRAYHRELQQLTQGLYPAVLDQIAGGDTEGLSSVSKLFDHWNAPGYDAYSDTNSAMQKMDMAIAIAMGYRRALCRGLGIPAAPIVGNVLEAQAVPTLALQEGGTYE